MQNYRNNLNQVLIEQLPGKSINQKLFRFLDFSIDPSFQEVNRLVLLFKDNGGRRTQKRYYLPLVETKDYSVMNDGRSFSDESVKNSLITHDNSQEFATGQRDE